MQRLDKIVSQYLKMDTNYALVITGEWGAGKTYYFNNILKNKIKDTETYKDASKKYRPILVSLFGLKSIEEIQTEILLSLNPIFKNKAVKLGVSISKSLIKGILHLKGWGKIYNFVEETDVDKNDWINLNELVICFDDLERISGKLNIEEFIGYVNSLVENDNVKVLIIANEDKIEDKRYKVLKEKVVNNSIEFIQDINESFDSLIKIKFEAFPEYKKYLETRKEFILEIFSKKCSNLRILGFALIYFQNIFSEIRKNIFTIDALKEKEAEILSKLLKYTIVISICYKEGDITFKNTEELDRGYVGLNLFSERGHFSKEKTEEKSYRRKLIETYYNDDQYTFYKSVYNFITGGDIINYNNILDDLKAIYNISENKILPQYEIIQKLSFSNWFLLNDKDYLILTREMLKYSDKGAYSIKDYCSVFVLASRFGNPLNLNLEKLKERIIKGMKKGKKNYTYVPSLDFHLQINPNEEHKDILNDIINSTLKLNNEINTSSKTSNSKKLEILCYSNFEAFSEETLNRDNIYIYTAILNNFNSNKFYSFFLKSKNDIKWKIVLFIKRRYDNSLDLALEKNFLLELHAKVAKKCNVLKNKNVTGFIFHELNTQLRLSIDKL